MMKQNEIYEDGYMTVEAALLFPIIFTIIIQLLYLGFFMYDRCLLENSAYIAALRGSRIQLADNNEIYDKTYILAQELVNKRMFAATNARLHVKVSFDEVVVGYDAEVIPPVGTLLVRVLNHNGFQIHVEKHAKRILTIPIIREFRRAEKLLDKNHGGTPDEQFDS